jgi:hypothetical protein
MVKPGRKRLMTPDQLKRALDILGLSYEQAGKRLDMSRQSLYRMANGKQHLRKVTHWAVLGLLGMLGPVSGRAIEAETLAKEIMRSE